MPTFTPLVSRYQKKDGKYRVYIHVHVSKKDKTDIDTGIYVVKQQLNKDMQIKDRDVLRVVLEKIKEFEDILLGNLGGQISYCSAKYIKKFIESKLKSSSPVDFVEFSISYTENLLLEGEKQKTTQSDRNKKEKRAKHIRTTINAFVDCFGEKFDISTFNKSVLEKFEKHLRSERTIIRKNQFGNLIKTKRNPLSNTGVHDYMIDIQTLYNAAQDKYNDIDSGIVIIPNNPFKSYKIPTANPVSLQKKNTDIEKIRRIFNYKGTGAAEFGRDCYMLSLFLIGINSVDLYEMKFSCFEDGRLNYNRSKTTDRRPDKAFISIKIEPEADKIISKYRDKLKERVFSFHNTYSSPDIFNKAINKGIKKMCKDINSEIDREIILAENEDRKKELEKQKIENNITYYSARHSWATIVRNTLGYSKYIIAECLNHSVSELRTTDRYIEKTFTWIDEINRKFIDLVIKS